MDALFGSFVIISKSSSVDTQHLLNIKCFLLWPADSFVCYGCAILHSDVCIWAGIPQT
jgi:hypothetical protein